MAAPSRWRVLAAVLYLGAASAAQAATVAVTVIDRDGNPVPDAVVVVIPATAGAGRAPLATDDA